MSVRWAALALVLGAVSCVGVPPGTPLRLDWKVSEQEKAVDAQVASVLRFPVVLRGDETWWLGDGWLVIDGRGRGGEGAAGEERTWLLADQDWVYTLDLRSGDMERMPLERWEEERLRQTRAWLVAAFEGSQTASVPWDDFLGSTRLTRERSGSDWTLAVAPGRLWHLSGRAPGSVDWSNPLLAAGFEGISLRRARIVGAALRRADPATVREVLLPRGATTLVVNRRLVSVRREPPPAQIRNAPQRMAPALAAAEAQLPDDFPALWALVTHPAQRPPGVDLRDLRWRLEKVATPADLPLVRERIRNSRDRAECEELFHLIYALDPRQLHDWLSAAIEHGDLSTVLEIVSVLSLRQPRGVPELIGELLNSHPSLWNGRPAEERNAARNWLLAVRLWLEGLARNPSESRSTPLPQPATLRQP